MESIVLKSVPALFADAGWLDAAKVGRDSPSAYDLCSVVRWKVCGVIVILGPVMGTRRGCCGGMADRVAF